MPADSYQSLTPDQQKQVLDEVSRKLGISPAIIEKDYWVCRTLDALFHLPELSDHLVFKGGTSLSKAYGLIERFSEDVDVSFHRDYLGFAPPDDPESIEGTNARKRRMEELQNACIEKIGTSLLPALQRKFEEDLKGISGWSLEIDSADPQAIQFHFPQAGVEAFPYIKPSVKIELGARSDVCPREERDIRSFIGQSLEQDIGVTTVHTLAAERTFWEKATILHAEYHRNQKDLNKKMPSHYARHYHDLAKLAQSEVADRALADDELRKRVVEHKSVYFQSAGSRYDLAVPGSFKLVPPPDRIPELEKDHNDMRQMFFNEPPAMAEVLEILQKLEDRINTGSGVSAAAQAGTPATES